MKRINLFVWFACGLLLLGPTACDTNNLIDTNSEMVQRNWSYTDKVKTSVEVKDSAAAYAIKFKLRHTSDYRYSNIYILMTIGGPGLKKTTRRFEYRLAESDGQWLGKGSGNLYTYSLPMLSDFHFPQTGTYYVEIEQNMRDNPLREISDVGITVSKKNNK